jgi:hypothetical protein
MATVNFEREQSGGVLVITTIDAAEGQAIAARAKAMCGKDADAALNYAQREWIAASVRIQQQHTALQKTDAQIDSEKVGEIAALTARCEAMKQRPTVAPAVAELVKPETALKAEG